MTDQVISVLIAALVPLAVKIITDWHNAALTKAGIDVDGLPHGRHAKPEPTADDPSPPTGWADAAHWVDSPPAKPYDQDDEDEPPL